jgi:cysteine desulfurase
MQALRDRLEAGLLAGLPGAYLYGADAERLPNTSCWRFGALDADLVLGKLERAGVLASSGAACSAGGTQPSHVLLAMGEPALQAKAGVRFSLGRETTAAEIDHCIAAVLKVIATLQAEPPRLAADAISSAVSATVRPAVELTTA